MSSNLSFPGRRILVVEDDLLIGLEVKAALDDLGCDVIGPIAAVTPAIDVARAKTLDAAVLDINLGRALSFPIADVLIAANVPFIFLTAYNRAVLPPPYSKRPVLSKPFAPLLLAVELARVLGG